MTESVLVEDPEVIRIIRPNQARKGWLWWAIGVGGVALSLALWSFSSAPVAYQTTEVRRGDLVEVVTAVGTLEPLESVEVGSDLSGKVIEVLVEVNARVEKGAVLARVDPTPFQNAVRQAKAQLNQAKAQLAQSEVAQTRAEQEAERTLVLVSKNAATEVELIDARLAVADARAAVAASEASVELRRAALQDAEEDLKKTTITAPISGVIMQRLVDPGQTVVSAMSATSLFEIASDLSVLKARVDVDEADVARIQANLPVQFTVAAWPDRVFQARITSVDIAPEEGSDVVSYPAELQVPNPEGALRPGMTATADIEVDRIEEQLLVPSLALKWAPEGTKATGKEIYILVNGQPQAVPVTVVGSEGSDVAVEGKLDATSLVITGPVAEEKHP